MITSTFRTGIVNYVYNQINAVKLIINDTKTSASIQQIKKNSNSIDIYVDLLLQDPSDIINGIEVYNSSNQLIARDLPNLTYNVQSATYVYRLKIIGKNGIIGG
jgi:hypothetical protein